MELGIAPIDGPVEELGIPAGVGVRPPGSEAPRFVLHQGVNEPLVLGSEAFTGQFFADERFEPRDDAREILEMVHLTALNRQLRDDVSL